MESIVISGFPGTGKSYFTNDEYVSRYKDFATDSDSSKFDKANFPANYIEHIKSKLGVVKYIFVSSHKEVRDALVENGIEFTLVYPHKSLKLEYLNRYKDRGSKDAFIDLLDKNWDNWLDELWNQKGCKHIVLESGKFMSNTSIG